jgi:hypothetical protein
MLVQETQSPEQVVANSSSKDEAAQQVPRQRTARLTDATMHCTMATSARTDSTSVRAAEGQLACEGPISGRHSGRGTPRPRVLHR